MSDHQTVVVYIPARHGRRLRALGYDPAEYVRQLVRVQLDWEARMAKARDAAAAETSPTKEKQ